MVPVDAKRQVRRTRGQAVDVVRVAVVAQDHDGCQLLPDRERLDVVEHAGGVRSVHIVDNDHASGPVGGHGLRGLQLAGGGTRLLLGPGRGHNDWGFRQLTHPPCQPRPVVIGHVAEVKVVQRDADPRAQ